MSPSAPQPRVSGGFNQGLGNFNDSFNEHLSENSMQSALQQKTLAQQATSSQQSTTGGSALGTPVPEGPKAPAVAPPPRELGSLSEELVIRPIQDVWVGLKSFFDINTLLGINPVQDDPATQQQKKAQLNRWQQLNAEQQQVADALYKEKMQTKQREEQEKQAAEQQRQQAAAQTLQMPSSPSKGPGQEKPKAVQKLEQDRKTMSGPASAN